MRSMATHTAEHSDTCTVLNILNTVIWLQNKIFPTFPHSLWWCGGLNNQFINMTVFVPFICFSMINENSTGTTGSRVAWCYSSCCLRAMLNEEDVSARKNPAGLLPGGKQHATHRNANNGRHPLSTHADEIVGFIIIQGIFFVLPYLWR